MVSDRVESKISSINKENLQLLELLSGKMNYNKNKAERTYDIQLFLNSAKNSNAVSYSFEFETSYVLIR